MIESIPLTEGAPAAAVSVKASGVPSIPEAGVAMRPTAPVMAMVKPRGWPLRSWVVKVSGCAVARAPSGERDRFLRRDRAGEIRRALMLTTVCASVRRRSRR